MTSDLAVVQQLHNTPDLPERDRGAAEAFAAGLRDAKAENTPHCPPPRRPWPSTWATWPQPAGPSPPSSRPARPSPIFTPPPGCRRATTRPSTRWCPRRSKGGATGPRHPGRQARSPPTPSPGSARSSDCPREAAADECLVQRHDPHGGTHLANGGLVSLGQAARAPALGLGSGPPGRIRHTGSAVH